jgi:hypothetical protein
MSNEQPARKLGIYRVRYEGKWTVAVFDGTAWWLAGSDINFTEDFFETIGDYLGPEEPPSNN